MAQSARETEDGQPQPLPSGVAELQDIYDGKAKLGGLHSFVGIVKDARAPMPTAKTDYKSEITIYDRSLESGSEGVRLSIFGPKEQMPDVGTGDVVYAVKVKNWSGTESLVTHHSSTLHVYSSKAIPKPPRSARGALLSAKKGSRVPTDAEHTYVSWFYHNVDKDAIPDEASFQHAVTESLNIKDKFGLLRDVVEGRFYDLLVRAVRDPFPSGDKVTLYATDYTENPNFFDSPASGPGDPYGYTRREGQSAEWVGPPGRRSIQITCYEPHATVVQEELRAGGWASLRNVHIKYGSNNLHLEGYMRGEQGLVHQGRVNVAVHDFNNSEVELDQRSKDALRRWREFEKSRKKQGKEEVQPNGSNTKRKADGEGAGARPNSKQRRKLKRLEAEKKAKEDEARAKMQRFAVEDELELNSYIRCEGRSLDPTTIAEIGQLIDYETTVNGVMKTLKLPFINAKHKTIARVTDFRPDRLEDFACSRKHTPWDLLSDNSADSTSDSSESDEDLAGSGPRIWEWHFALQLEDPSSKVKPPPRIWVLVDNAEAQLLTDLDASNLREDSTNLNALREKLFTLWGDLEEQKAKQQAKNEDLAARRPGDKPPLEDSDSEGQNRHVKVSNKPFMCCLRQYGVRVRENDPHKASAGEGKAWQRTFAMFGTKLSA